MRLAREGVAICAGATVVAAVVCVVGLVVGGNAALFVIFAFWLAAVFCLQFFREPNRRICGELGAALAPADGRVVFVGPATPPDNMGDGKDKIKISVFMNVFNAHVNRAPLAGKVTRSRRFAGKFFNAALSKASEHNERHLVAIDTPYGEAVCAQIAGLLARRVFCYATVGAVIGAGERYGFIRFGSRVDLYLPAQCRPAVAIGDKVLAGVSVVARFPPPAEEAEGDDAGGSKSAAQEGNAS